VTLSRAIVRAWRTHIEAPIPDAVLLAGRMHLLDVVGVGIAASALEQGEPYARLSAGERGPISLLNGGSVAAAADAAMINGGLIHSLEFDDTHTASIVHGSAVLAPTVLALAEALGLGLDRALRAYLLGYDLLIRLGLAGEGAFQRHGFQVTSVAGTLVAALIAAELSGASEDESVHAIGIALSQASGVFEFLSNGSSVKSLHPGWAAHSGIVAARLARSGLTGPETAIEGTRGLYASFARDHGAPDRLRSLLADFGSRWHAADVAFKFLPCCHYLHPFVEAASTLAGSIPDPAAIEEVVLAIAPGAAPIVCEPWAIKIAPADGHAARWSLPVVVAARLIEGRVDLDTFRKRASDAVLDLAARSRWQPLEPNRFPHAFEAGIAIRLRDGRVLEASVADVYGNASRAAKPEDVLAKFRANARRSLATETVAALERFFLGGEPTDFQAFSNALSKRLHEG
jgi:2-methylcitrate dehydratase PrpD